MRKLLLTLVLLSFQFAVNAENCTNYPYTDGMNIEDVEGGTKILSTMSAIVSSDHPASIRDAKDEATLLAKAQISKFLNEEIQSDESITRAVEETKSMQGPNQGYARKELIQRVKSLRSSSRSLLRGVVLLGDCYTKGSEVRVSVGLKPSTIAQAGNLAAGVNQSFDSSQTPQTANTAETEGNSDSRTANEGGEGYSNTSRLNEF